MWSISSTARGYAKRDPGEGSQTAKQRLQRYQTPQANTARLSISDLSLPCLHTDTNVVKEDLLNQVFQFII